MNDGALVGLTWDHPRALRPLREASIRFEALTGIESRWTTRSLQSFADEPLEDMVDTCDLIVYDHPFVGRVATRSLLLPLDQLVAPRSLDDLRHNSVGASYETYFWDGQQWGLPIDAACHVGCHRPDLMEERLPQTWDEVLELGKALRRAGQWLGLPLYPVDAFNTFLSLCAEFGEDPYSSGVAVVADDIAHRALQTLEQLVMVAHPNCLEATPIGLLDTMATQHDIPYCPAVFGYAVYSFEGYAPNILEFSQLPSSGDGPGRGILGGAGLGVSRSCSRPDVAAEFAEFIAQGTSQQTFYAASGGQPSHLEAWLDPEVNAMTRSFYASTISTMRNAYVRPRYDGFLEVHTASARIVHEHLQLGTKRTRDTLDELDSIYVKSLDRI